MIDLYISSLIPTTNYIIAKLMNDQGIKCQVYSNISSIIKDGKKAVEDGYHIKIFNLKPCDFREKVWNILQKELKLICAFVKEDNTYMGCVYNWPKIFTNSKCGACCC